MGGPIDGPSDILPPSPVCVELWGRIDFGSVLRVLGMGDVGAIRGAAEPVSGSVV